MAIVEREQVHVQTTTRVKMDIADMMTRLNLNPAEWRYIDLEDRGDGFLRFQFRKDEYPVAPPA